MDKIPLNIMTFNIRYDNDWDHEHSWESRKDCVLKKIKDIMPDSLGIQEGMINQVKFLSSKLPDYNYVGVSRGDGMEQDEFAAIFLSYKKNSPY